LIALIISRRIALAQAEEDYVSARTRLTDRLQDLESQNVSSISPDMSPNDKTIHESNEDSGLSKTNFTTFDDDLRKWEDLRDL